MSETKARRHADKIILWANNKDAEVWHHLNGEWSQLTTSPCWSEETEYAVVLPEFKEAWMAWLDNELEFLGTNGFWDSWRLTDGVPAFNKSPDKYRRKPKYRIPKMPDDYGKQCFFSNRVLRGGPNEDGYTRKLCGVADHGGQRFCDDTGVTWRYAVLVEE